MTNMYQRIDNYW